MIFIFDCSAERNLSYRSIYKLKGLQHIDDCYRDAKLRIIAAASDGVVAAGVHGVAISGVKDLVKAIAHD